jgi:hypothetical protein
MNAPMNTAVLPEIWPDPFCYLLLLLLLCLFLALLIYRTLSRPAAAAALCLSAACVEQQGQARHSHPSRSPGESTMKLRLASTHQQ